MMEREGERGWSSGDRCPEIQEIEGGRRYILRVIRPDARSFEVKSGIRREMQHREQEKDGIPFPSHEKDIFEYRKLFPEIGSPKSLDMQSLERPLEIAFMRHAQAKGNEVSEASKNEARVRIEALIDDLKVDRDTRVFLLSSSVADYQVSSDEIRRRSRTDATAQVVASVLQQRGVKYIFNTIDDEDGYIGSATLQVRERLREFWADEEPFEEACKRFEEFKENKQNSQGLHPADTMHPTAYASFAPDLKTLQEKTGIEEMSSATVARGLSALDRVEKFFTDKDKHQVDFTKTVVILVSHGQFGTDISEAFRSVVKQNEFPILLMQNGGYWRVKVGKNSQGQIVEEFILESGQRTGLQEIILKNS